MPPARFMKVFRFRLLIDGDTHVRDVPAPRGASMLTWEGDDLVVFAGAREDCPVSLYEAIARTRRVEVHAMSHDGEHVVRRWKAVYAKVRDRGFKYLNAEDPSVLLEQVVLKDCQFVPL